jgi:hypothetical protein
MSAVEITLLAGSAVFGGGANLGVIERVARYSSRVLSTLTGLSFSGMGRGRWQIRFEGLALHQMFSRSFSYLTNFRKYSKMTGVLR